ncbi:hypothetical protein [Actinoplanes derwentensis]|uniref:Uncharacterized protein n=1 Tax=Actinoplanes derwentensis TaxID=113562 RepID=A0A1H2A0F3_9ACTN|nr:hypothetical protein [Actinoplanes derwentensis]GID83443.1 hypothetical protein Ade03nite_23670 [Actinoplanes derwentensis]SDT39434.1 hypothetical protein SAMN04489716_3597 [Actinoplanes derwentensis]
MTHPVAAYADLDEETLYAELGRHLLGDGLGISPDDGDSASDYGRRWFADRYHRLQQTVCLQPRARALLGTTGSDRIVDAAAIFELLPEAAEDPMKAALLAVLIARVGLGTFCSNVKVPG